MWHPQVYLRLTLRPLILAIDLIVLLTALAVVVLRVPRTFLSLNPGFRPVPRALHARLLQLIGIPPVAIA